MSTNKAMGGGVIAFPMSRHGKDGLSFVTSVAAKMLELCPGSAEKHLVRQLDRKGDALRRRGFDEAIIQAEKQKAEAAIRAALWRAVYQGGVV